MSKQFIAAINQLCVEKNIPREKVVEAVEGALKTAYRKDFGNKDQEIDVTLNEESGTFTVYLIRTVVDEVTMPESDILISEAKKYKKDAQLEDEIKIDVTPSGFGRIAAQAAKQVILQRIQEAEREVLFDTFKEREGELLNAQISRIDRGQVYLEVDRNTLLFPRDGRVLTEQYHVGQRFKVFLQGVEQTSRGPNMMLTRRSETFVKKVFEFEIPEIKTGIVEIMGIAREAGTRTKIAVSSNDEKVDPVGACVGQRGSRIHVIMDELMGEMIDVVTYKENLNDFIEASLAPAKVSFMKVDEKTKVADVYVEDDQRPLAIGRSGQNVRLASKLTGYELNLKDVSEAPAGLGNAKPKAAAETEEVNAPKTPTAKIDATKVDDLDLAPAVKEKLIAAGISEVAVLQKMSLDDLVTIGGIGKVSGKKIMEVVGTA